MMRLFSSSQDIDIGAEESPDDKCSRNFDMTSFEADFPSSAWFSDMQPTIRYVSTSDKTGVSPKLVSGSLSRSISLMNLQAKKIDRVGGE
jgi:hypothetical protein